MRNFYWIITALLMAAPLLAQQPVADKSQIQVVDTLTAQQKKDRYPVLLQQEYDSLLRPYVDSIASLQVTNTSILEKEADEKKYLQIAILVFLVLVILLLYLSFRNQKKFQQTVTELKNHIQRLEWAAIQREDEEAGVVIPLKGKQTVQALEKKLQALAIKMEKGEQEKTEIEQQLQQYKAIGTEYEALKKGMSEVYKLRSYPGYSKEKTEIEIVKTVLDSEKAVVNYAYEHFLKEIIAIADANKNNPARISPESRQAMLDYLLSLALFYSEYLYLRIQDLSIGGEMTTRFEKLKNNGYADVTGTQPLSTEHGSRALVLRMVLEEIGITHLSYPVFDETNLNLS